MASQPQAASLRIAAICDHARLPSKAELGAIRSQPQATMIPASTHSERRAGKWLWMPR